MILLEILLIIVITVIVVLALIKKKPNTKIFFIFAGLSNKRK